MDPSVEVAMPFDASRPRSTRRRGRAGLLLLLVGAFLGGGLLSAWLLRHDGSSDSAPAAPATPSLPPASGTTGVAALLPAPAAAEGLPGEPGAELVDSRRNAVVVAAERTGPAVVSISVTQIRYVRESPFGLTPSPFDDFFRRFYRGRVYGQEVSSLGSGVIIDARGIVVTNEHVLRDAREIKVTLADGRTMDATLIGSDRTYDLAVLRIEGQDLPVAPVGTSADLLVGEWAIALGNPFGFLLNEYQPTVTVGVISAINRDIKPEGDSDAIYKEMIQTDAAINPGNSGGPLVNSLGEVIGINTFIFSTAGGNLGMGFAIPIDTVVRVVREILEYGRVRQIWIGIRVQEISQMVANYFGIRDRRGLLVWGLEDGSPAAEAGLQVGDIIRQVNGRPVSRASEAQRLIFGAAIGEEIRLTIERDEEQWDVSLVLEEAPAD
ncbi:MAG: trypsin-like serine protease [Candidatus Eisenbacteria bacterium]|nr:trypsin-like serine protease [Candidatus Eisenbacteria bacterium]